MLTVAFLMQWMLDETTFCSSFVVGPGGLPIPQINHLKRLAPDGNVKVLCVTWNMNSQVVFRLIPLSRYNVEIHLDTEAWLLQLKGRTPNYWHKSEKWVKLMQQQLKDVSLGYSKPESSFLSRLYSQIHHFLLLSMHKHPVSPSLSSHISSFPSLAFFFLSPPLPSVSSKYSFYVRLFNKRTFVKTTKLAKGLCCHQLPIGLFRLTNIFSLKRVWKESAIWRRAKICLRGLT